LTIQSLLCYAKFTPRSFSIFSREVILAMIYYPEDSIFVTGVAKVSKDDAINAMYGTFSLSMVIDIRSNRILSISGNMVMQETNDFLANLLIGHDIVNEVDKMCEILKRRFLALSQKAVMVALRDAQNHFIMAYPNAGRHSES